LDEGLSDLISPRFSVPEVPDEPRAGDLMERVEPEDTVPSLRVCPEPSLRRITFLPEIGWTNVLPPTGLRLRLLLVRVMAVRPVRDSPLRATLETFGARS